MSLITWRSRQLARCQQAVSKFYPQYVADRSASAADVDGIGSQR